ncbi:hypothetical protein FACS1894147_11730 [Spirochaetia bacterium]|nr:hypothetical protein FACS1894147_11730 [Spirochaetia bacterium]
MRQEFSIVARRGKKGVTFYVRYFQSNKMIPSQWSTRTDNREAAAVFSRNNKERLLKKYFNRKEGKTLFSILRKYYDKDSGFLEIDAARGRKLSESSRKILHGFVVNTFVPFLLDNKIREFHEIKAALINRFQNFLLMEKGLAPQSINRQISGVKAIFNHLYMTGHIEHNFIKDTMALRSANNRIRGCYSMDDLLGIFKDPWEDKKAYLLCALIYSTGLRNGEIKNLRVKDIVARGGVPPEAVQEAGVEAAPVFFLNVERSKTINGIRMAPLHHRLKEFLDGWTAERGLGENDYLFAEHKNQKFCKPAKEANDFMGSLLNRSPSELRNANITFYSGRHFYKTMLNSRRLGDVEELFMGHSVSREVSERYNHKDKRGEEELLREARRALEVVDECLFR